MPIVNENPLDGTQQVTLSNSRMQIPVILFFKVISSGRFEYIYLTLRPLL